MQSNQHGLDWPNQPLPFKIYTQLAPIPLPMSFEASRVGALSAIAGIDAPSEGQPRWPEGGGASDGQALTLQALARLCYFSNGVTRVLRGMPFRAAACTGALYHIELYVVCAELADLPAGVYHFDAHDNAFRQLRAGDFRKVFGDSVAPVTIVMTSTWWRNAWKYQSRAYRHAFWDSGTVLANLLSVANAQNIAARVDIGFVDAEVNRLLDVQPAKEAAIALVAIGAPSTTLPNVPDIAPLGLATRPLSAHQVDYPLIVAAHAASSLSDVAAVNAWRAGFQRSLPADPPTLRDATDEPVEAVILRRGSSRRFAQESIARDALQTLLEVSTSPTPMDAFVPADLYVIVNAVEGLDPGAYVWDRASRALQQLRAGAFRREAAYLDLGQPLAGDAAFDVYWLVDLDALDDRGYRAAQLSPAIEAGKLYLAAYSIGLGATGLTFFDDDVTRFFSPHAAGKSVMFLTAVGHAFKPSGGQRGLRPL